MLDWLNYYTFKSDSFIFIVKKDLIVNSTNNKESVLSNQCSQLLKLLCLSAGEVFERDELINYIWDKNYETGSKGLTQAVWQLRKNFTEIDLNDSELITVHRNKGYELDVDVRGVATSHMSTETHALFYEAGSIILDKSRIFLNSQETKILEYLINEKTSNDIFLICSMASCNRFELLNLLGQLQDNIHQIRADATFLDGWNQYSLHISILPTAMTNSSSQLDNGLCAIGTSDRKNDKVEQSSISRFVSRLKHNAVISKIRGVELTKVLTYATAALLILCVTFIYLFTLEQSRSKTYENADLALVTELTENLHRLLHDKEDKLKQNSDALLELLIENYESTLEYSHTPPVARARALLAFSSIHAEVARYDEAEKLIKEAQDILIDNPSSQIIYSSVFAEMQYLTANFLFKTRRYVEALHFVDSALKELSTKNNVDTLHFQKLNIMRTRLFLNMGQYEESLASAREIIDSLELLPEDTERNALMTDAIKYVAIGLRNMGDIAGAQNELEALLSSNKTIFGELTKQNTSVFQVLAAIYASRGNYDEALKHYRASESFHDNNNDQYSINKALVLHNMSYVLFELGQKDDTLKAIDDAIEIYDFHFGEKSSNHAFLYSTKATHHFNVGNISEAKINNALAIEMFEHPDNKKHILRNRALQLAAHIYRLEGDVTLCRNIMHSVSESLSESISDESHWMRKVANISSLSCEVPLASIVYHKTMPSSLPIPMIMTELEKMYGSDGLPVRQISNLLDQSLSR